MKEIIINGKSLREISKETSESFYDLLSKQDYNVILDSIETFEEAEYIFDIYARHGSPLAFACVERMRKSLGESLLRYVEWEMSTSKDS